MNTATRATLITLLAAMSAGCPVFDQNDPGNGCLADPTQCGSTSSGAGACKAPSDCGANETCGQNGTCQSGDCTFAGCVTGYYCVIGSDQSASCEPLPSSSSSSSGAGGASSTSSSSSSSGGGVTFCGHPADCSASNTCGPNGTCQPGDCTQTGCILGYACDPAAKQCSPGKPNACIADADCTDPGSACVDGSCAAPADQCSDATQCPAGDKCAAGKCVAGCSADADCPSGFACDAGLGLCSKPAHPCTITSDCGGSTTVCVDGACVARSQGGVCDAGRAWVANGCVPAEKPVFICNIDGQQDACSAGSICLHHACYVGCEAPNGSACDALPTFNVCKSVTTSSGSHAVCGSAQNLGSDCDPTAGPGIAACAAGKICIDGFCK